MKKLINFVTSLFKTKTTKRVENLEEAVTTLAFEQASTDFYIDTIIDAHNGLATDFCLTKEGIHDMLNRPVTQVPAKKRANKVEKVIKNQKKTSSKKTK